MENIGKVYLTSILLYIISSGAVSGELEFLVKYQHFNSLQVLFKKDSDTHGTIAILLAIF